MRPRRSRGSGPREGWWWLLVPALLTVVAIQVHPQIRLATCATTPELCSRQTGLRGEHAPTPDNHPANGGGGSVLDFNRDGHPDLFVQTGGGAADRLYENQGDATFRDVAREAGVARLHLGVGSAVGDYDGDGWPDIFVTSFGTPAVGPRPGAHLLYRNNHDGTFSEVGVAAGVNWTSRESASGTSAVFGDYDLDGDLDLAVAAWFPAPGGNALFENNGDGTFSTVSVRAGFELQPRGFTPRFADMNGDRFPELLWVGDYGTSRYLVNNRDGTFRDATAGSGTALEGNGMGNVVADLDNDGRLDWFVTSISTHDPRPEVPGTGNYLYRNTGMDQFSVSRRPGGTRDGGWAWGAVAIDLDHDMDLDLVQTNGWSEPNGVGYPEWSQELTRVFRNQGVRDGELIFTDVARRLGFAHLQQGRGVVRMDYDSDGDQDFLIFNNRAAPTLVRNELPAGPQTGWLRVFLDTSADRSVAPDGLGSMVRVSAGGVTQHRYLDGETSYLGSSELSVHFGLGPHTRADLLIRWPDGAASFLNDLATNQTLHIAKPAPAPADQPAASRSSRP